MEKHLLSLQEYLNLIQPPKEKYEVYYSLGAKFQVHSWKSVLESQQNLTISKVEQAMFDGENLKTSIKV